MRKSWYARVADITKKERAIHSSSQEELQEPNTEPFLGQGARAVARDGLYLFF